MQIKHAKTSAIADSGDTSLVRPSDWNADHVITNGGLVLLEQHTASSSASLDFTTFISGTYDEYQFEVVGILPASNSNLLVRMSTDGGSTYDSGANYSFVVHVASAAGPGSEGATGQTAIRLNWLGGGDYVSSGTAAHPVFGSLRLFAPGSTTWWKTVEGSFSYMGSGRILTHARGAYESTTAVNALQFLMSTGNIASGTIRVYGIAKT